MNARAWVSALGLLSAVCGEAASAGDDPGPKVSLSSRAAEAAVRNAVRGARARVARSRCRRLFSEFKDATGRTLQQALDAHGQTPAGYLGLILFADGQDLPQCRDSGVLAVTPRGSRVVYICGPQFTAGESFGAFVTEAVIIHEELHSLGLGEDPPSATEITVRVLESCHS